MTLNTIFLLALSILPAIALLFYFYYKDRDSEPKRLLMLIFFFGVLLIFPAIAIERYLQGFLPNTAFFNSFFIAGLTEEILKFLVVIKIALPRKAFNQVSDGMVYAIVASLGFASFENVLYVMNHGYEIGLLRAFTALPLHAFTAGIMGYYLGCSKFEDNPTKRKSLQVRGLLWAVLLHGAYNFWLFTESYLMILSYFQVYIMWRLVAIYWDYSEEPSKKEPLSFNMIIHYLWDKYTILQWVKICIATVFLVAIAILSTGAVVQLKDGTASQEMWTFLIIVDLVLALISYRLYRNVAKSINA